MEILKNTSSHNITKFSQNQCMNCQESQRKQYELMNKVSELEFAQKKQQIQSFSLSLPSIRLDITAIHDPFIQPHVYLLNELLETLTSKVPSSPPEEVFRVLDSLVKKVMEVLLSVQQQVDMFK